MLEDFARLMKWPNLNNTIKALRQKDADGALDSISSYALAFFSGLVLPGVGFLSPLPPLHLLSSRSWC